MQGVIRQEKPQLTAGLLGRVLLVALAVVVVCTLISWFMTTTAGAMTTAFGISTGRWPDEVAFYDRTYHALDEYLTARGFSPTRIPPEEPDPVCHWALQNQETTWYLEEKSTAHYLAVEVRIPKQNEAGIHVYVVWHGQGYSWRLDKIEERAESLCKELTDWWDNYTKDHPPPSLRPQRCQGALKTGQSRALENRPF